MLAGLVAAIALPVGLARRARGGAITVPFGDLPALAYACHQSAS
jgi:hypothetical protein